MRYITAPFRSIDKEVKMWADECPHPKAYRIMVWSIIIGAFAAGLVLSITVIVTTK